MILSARFVRRPRRPFACDWCERYIVGPLIYLYGMAEIGQRPYALRYHLRCCRENLTPQSEKFRAALAKAAESETAA
jgi:hypothetical protein